MTEYSQLSYAPPYFSVNKTFRSGRRRPGTFQVNFRSYSDPTISSKPSPDVQVPHPPQTHFDQLPFHEPAEPNVNTIPPLQETPGRQYHIQPISEHSGSQATNWRSTRTAREHVYQPSITSEYTLPSHNSNQAPHPKLPNFFNLFTSARGTTAVIYTIPRFLYYSTLLFIPLFYRTRVNHIFYGATMTEKEIASNYTRGPPRGPWRPKYWETVKQSWSDFISSTGKEWRTLNIVSVLLLSAIYNVLQLGGSGSSLVQCTALMSLISALMSLMFGCLYVIQFETMRRPHKAMQWAKDGLQSSRNAWWNVFILLALPSVWLAWSIVFFIICLMSVIWQPSGPTSIAHSLANLPLEVKIIVSVFLLIGVFHLCLILVTFLRYDSIDETWNERLDDIIRTASTGHGPETGGITAASGLRSGDIW